MAYSTIPKGSLYMNTVLYSGTGSEHTISGVSFQPDWTWLKSRTNGQPHMVSDAVRGGSKQLYPNDSGAETSYSQYLKSFNSDGFVLGTDGGINASGQTYASWNWKANGAGSANTNGSINSTVSVNTTAGFSIVSYTGTGSNATIGHGLGAAPAMVITKRRSSSDDWIVWQKGLANPASYLYLNGSDGEMGSVPAYQNITPTSTLLYPGTDGRTNGNGQTYISYCFAQKQGYSKFGNYKGNSSTDGPFLYTGFKPAFVILKRTDGGDSWVMLDNKRNEYNPEDKILLADTSGVETTQTQCDFLSNGFKLRIAGGLANGNGNSHIYMAFAENPFVATSGSDAIPVTAR